MKKLFVGLASVTLAVSAWGRNGVVADDSRGIPIDDCILAMKHRDAFMVRDVVWEDTFLQRNFALKTVLLLRPTNGLDAGYYSLIHEHLEIRPLKTYCGHFPFK